MRITCPKCQFKGLIDTGPLAFQTRVACVRCGTTFDAVLVDGEVMSSLPPDDVEEIVAPEAMPESVAQPEVEAQAEIEAQAGMEAQGEMDVRADSVAQFDSDAEVVSSGLSTADDVLALPQTAEASYQSVDLASVLEDVLHAPEAETAGPEDVFAERAASAADKGRAAAEESEALLPQASALPEMAGADGESSRKLGQARVEASAGYEGQGRGMRLMRISPLWLLVCGVAFVAVIFITNQFAKPAGEQEQRVAANNPAPGNKATNQALTQPPAPASNNHAATSVQEASQMAAPAPVVLKSTEVKASEQQSQAETQSEPRPVAAPEAEPKAVAHAPQTSGEKTGSLTIQVGSYNVIEQANDRVARLRAAGFDARVAAVELPKRGTWYRVQAGRFSGRAEAERYGQEMKAEGVAESYIITDAAEGK
jgi:cell division septation protein DedD